MYNIPSYRNWFFRQDLRPAYEYHRRFLQHLQFRRSAARWILKAPAHMFAAPALLSTYPDSRFVQLHRDPIDAVASVSSLVTILRRVFSDTVDPIQVGQDAMVYWSDALKTFMSVRDTLPSDRVCDLYYSDIRRDPIAAAKRVYEHFGWKLQPEIEQRDARRPDRTKFAAQRRPSLQCGLLPVERNERICRVLRSIWIEIVRGSTGRESRSRHLVPSRRFD